MKKSINSSRKITSDLFSRRLNDSLMAKYGYVPSAARFSDAFNLRAHGTTTIFRETARKWIRGAAIPELSRLKVLTDWLGLQPSTFLDGECNTTSINEAVSELNERSTNESTQKKLISLIKELHHKYIETLFITAWTLKEISRNPSTDFYYQKYLNSPAR
jgi:hypothetical protein